MGQEINVEKIIERSEHSEENRIRLHHILEGIMESKNVYFQPPESIKVNVPGIEYSRNLIRNQHANDDVYSQYDSYNVIVIDPNPDSKYVRRVSLMPMCTHNRHYKHNNLNYDSFTLYY